MESSLTAIGRWLVGPDAIAVLDAASVALVRERVRELAARIALPQVQAASLVNVASELAHNQLAHARHGLVAVREAPRDGSRGLEVMATDTGPGIADVARAFEGRPSRGTSLGIGLAAVLELADEVDMDVRLGEGTCVWARKFAHPGTRRRRVGVYGYACRGERTSGDDAAFARTGAGLIVGLADGLGHGLPAREAAQRARDVLLAHPELDPMAILSRCDVELARTRGAVMTVAQIDEERDEVAVASVGNVGAWIVGFGPSRRFGGSSYVLGAPGGARRLMTERQPMGRHELLVLFSDGVTSRLDLAGEPDLLREHPVVVAQRVVERFGRDTDDVTVVVVG